MDYTTQAPHHYLSKFNTQNPPSLQSSANNFNKQPSKKNSEKLKESNACQD